MFFILYLIKKLWTIQQLYVMLFLMTSLALTVSIPNRLRSSVHKLFMWLKTRSTNSLLHGTENTYCTICLIFFNCAVDDWKNFTHFSELVNSVLFRILFGNNFIKLSSLYSSSPLTWTLINLARSSKSVNLGT